MPEKTFKEYFDKAETTVEYWKEIAKLYQEENDLLKQKLDTALEQLHQATKAHDATNIKLQNHGL